MADRREREARVPVGNRIYYPNRFFHPYTDPQYRYLNSLDARVNRITAKLETRGADVTRVILDRVYTADRGQNYSLLIEAILTSRPDTATKLLETFKVSVDKPGDVIIRDQLFVGVTALWCASAIGDLKMVQILINNRANVDFITTKQSSTLRTNIDIHNIFNSTCLMAACYYNHLEVATCLLVNGAEINKQTSSGGTALHFVIRDEDCKMAKILISHNPMLLQDNQCLTPLLAAALIQNHKVLNFFLVVLDLTREERIDALELFGASCMNSNPSQLNLGLTFHRHAMLNRDRIPVLKKKVLKSVERYNNQIESQTFEAYENMIDHDELRHIEGLITRERILGENHPQLLQHLTYVGKQFETERNFKSCSLLYNHALKIAVSNRIAIHEDISRFTEMFYEMIKHNADIESTDIKNILVSAYDELCILRRGLYDKNNKTYLENLYYSTIESTLGLICVISDILSATFLEYQEDPEMANELMRIIKKINKRDFRTKENQTFLHLSLNHNTRVSNMLTTEICFPNYQVMKLLVDCGADVDAVDNDKNTPLHYIGFFLTDFPDIFHNNQEQIMSMVLELLDAGAHTDLVNKFGYCPHTEYLSNTLCLTDGTVRSLK